MNKVKALLLSLLAIGLVIEEWLWEALTALSARLSRLLHLERFDAWLRQCSPWWALLAFVIPVVAVAPIGLLGLVLIAHGLFLRGLMVEVIGKLLGTLLVARIFKLTKPQLLTFRWFAYLYGTVTGWLAWARAQVVNTAAYRVIQKYKERLSRWRKHQT